MSTLGLDEDVAPTFASANTDEHAVLVLGLTQQLGCLCGAVDRLPPDLLENVAGEMGAKMSAMDNATRNAGDMINRLTITYNRQRQAQITKELIEIISGAEAL